MSLEYNTQTSSHSVDNLPCFNGKFLNIAPLTQAPHSPHEWTEFAWLVTARCLFNAGGLALYTKSWGSFFPPPPQSFKQTLLIVLPGGLWDQWFWGQLQQSTDYNNISQRNTSQAQAGWVPRSARTRWLLYGWEAALGADDEYLWLALGVSGKGSYRLKITCLPDPPLLLGTVLSSGLREKSIWHSAMRSIFLAHFSMLNEVVWMVWKVCVCDREHARYIGLLYFQGQPDYCLDSFTWKSPSQLRADGGRRKPRAMPWAEHEARLG